MKIFRFRKNKNKRRYRIHFSTTKHMIGDVWAQNEIDAYKIGLKLRSTDLQTICEHSESISSINEFDDFYESFWPFKPLN